VDLADFFRHSKAVQATDGMLRRFSGTARIVGKRMRPLTWSKPHQGAQEMARRRRQIERGQLTRSNGLAES